MNSICPLDSIYSGEAALTSLPPKSSNDVQDDRRTDSDDDDDGEDWDREVESILSSLHTEKEEEEKDTDEKDGLEYVDAPLFLGLMKILVNDTLVDDDDDGGGMSLRNTKVDYEGLMESVAAADVEVPEVTW